MNYNCEKCKTKMLVRGTRKSELGVFRYRYCPTCPARVVTIEIPAEKYRELLSNQKERDE